MKCPNCGADLNEGMRFCSNCGSQIAAAEPAPQITGNSPTTTNKKSNSKVSKFTVGAVAAAAIAVTAGIGSFSLYQKSLISRAENAMASGDYELAIELYEKVSSVNENKSAAKRMVSKLTEAKAAVRDAGKALESGDESKVREYISKARSCVPDYKPALEIETAIELKDKLAEAENCVNSSEYAKALSLAKEIEAASTESEYLSKYLTKSQEIIKIVEDFETASTANAQAALNNNSMAEAENITAELLRRLPDSENGKAIKNRIDNMKSAMTLIQNAQSKKSKGDYSGALTDLDNAFSKYPAYKTNYTQLYNDITDLKSKAEAAQKAAQAKEKRTQDALNEYKQFANSIDMMNIYVNANTVANYANNTKLTDFAMYRLGNDGQPAFAYPKNIFSEYYYNYGSMTFYGTDDSMMYVECFQNYGEKGIGYWQMVQSEDLYDVTEVISTDSRAIFWGYTDSSRREIVYKILYADDYYSTIIEYYYPTPVKGSSDESYKNYVIDCIYRMFEASGTSYLPRSYAQFVNNEPGTKK